MGKRKNKGTFTDWIKALIIAFILLFFIHLFIFQSFSVVNTEMEKTVFSGDYVLVNKLAWGTRSPVTLLSFPFFDDTIPFIHRCSYLPLIQLPPWRLPGYSHIRRNDLVAFNYPEDTDLPIDKRKKCIMRCVGLPGDKINIKNEQLFVNGEKQNNPRTVQFNYYVIPAPGRKIKPLLNKYEIKEGSRLGNKFLLTMTQAKAQRIKRDSLVQSVEPVINTQPDITVYPQKNLFNWNIDNFGTVIVPKAGKKLKLSKKNIEIYRKVIEVYEKNTLAVRGNDFYINNDKCTSYKVKNNYYFVLDDNRGNAKDSRYWGFLPENHIIGKPVMVWYSVYKNKAGYSEYRWKRLFRRLNKIGN